MSKPKVPAEELRRVVSIRLKPAMKAALKKAADDDTRPMSVLIEVILVAWLKEKGFL